MGGRGVEQGAEEEGGGPPLGSGRGGVKAVGEESELWGLTGLRGGILGIPSVL